MLSRSSSSSISHRQACRSMATAPTGSVLVEERSGLGNNDFFADPARHQVRHQRVQPAGGLVVGPAQLGVPARQQPQHRGVVLDPHRRPAPPPAAPRSRPSGRRWGRSSPTGPSPTAAPATPTSRGCPRRVHRPRGAAGPTGSPARRRTRSPTTARRRRGAWPTPTAPAPARRSRRTSRSSSTRSAVSIATAVWVRLCGSMPIITIADPPISWVGPRWALLIPDARAAALFRATPRRNTDGPHLVSKARPRGRQAVSERRPPALHRRYEPRRSDTPNQSGSYGVRGRLAVSVTSRVVSAIAARAHQGARVTIDSWAHGLALGPRRGTPQGNAVS